MPNEPEKPESQFAIRVAMITTALIAIQGVSVLSWCLVQKITPDTALLTVYVSIISSAATGLIALLANPHTRRTAGITVANTPENPVPIEPVK